MIQAASTVYLVADSTKFGRPSFASLGGIEEIDFLITDAGITASVRESLEKKGVKIIVAEV